MAKTYEMFSGEELVIAEKILRRRMQMMVHSYIYYVMNTNIISDYDFNTWGHELIQLQSDYPEISKQVEYCDAFSNWDANTGFDLPRDERIQKIAERLCANVGKTLEKPVTKQQQKPQKKVRKSLF